MKIAEQKVKEYVTEAGEYLGTLKFISKGIERGYLDLDYIKKIIDERLDKWDRKL